MGYYSDIFVKWQVFPFIKNGLLTNFKAKNATAPAASRFHYAAGEMAREFDTSKLKRILQSLETGLFFCQIFVFII